MNKLSNSIILNETVRLLNTFLNVENRGYREYPNLLIKEIKIKSEASEFDFNLSLDDFSEIYLTGIAKILAFKIKSININPLFVHKELDKDMEKAIYNGIILYLSKDYTFSTYIV